jgi:nitroimidazol reductase NimA-like FMN-containing flavoprotein (pyridoxamine 5'-phosphate oxidase superfamily)
MTDPRGAGAGDEELTPTECFRLLGTQVVGRVAVAEPGAAPLVVPVNFVLRERRIIFRTAYGTTFRAAVLGERPVSFQVDEIDLDREVGWSVLVQGRASEVDGWEASGLQLQAWAPGPKPHVVEVLCDQVSGRRLHGNDLAGWRSGSAHL